MLDTEEEYNFLKEAQKGFSNNYSYRIMGETTARAGQYFEYADYTPSYVHKSYWYNPSGKYLWGTWKNKLLVVCSNLLHLCQKYEKGTYSPHIIDTLLFMVAEKNFIQKNKINNNDSGPFIW